MSFILEALKKSEQQRQQQATPAKKVNKRTLSLQASPSGRRFPWIVAGLLPLILLCGWWYFVQTDKSQTAPQMVVQSTSPVPPQAVATPDTAVKVTTTEILQQEVEEANPAMQSAPPQATIAVESSPVPRALGSPKTTQPAPLQGKIFSTADRKIQTIDAPVETLVISQPEPQPFAEEELYPSSTRLPLYSELPGGLRGRMPAINMNMHFYNKEPNRRLVRINDLLLHEGDWVARDLQLVEISGDGATLDFLGKTFILPRNRR
jgi:general secretion pathway protein B